METTHKIHTFTDLDAWQMGHKLVLAVYECTKSFPTSEQFGLTSQIRRAAVSITSNVAEGFSYRTKEQKNRYYRIALGSLHEVQNQLLIARDIGACTNDEYEKCHNLSIHSAKLIHGLLRTSRTLASNT